MIGMMKAQGLPIRTIVLIIIVLIVLAVVLVFFYGSLSRNKENANKQVLMSKCKNIVSQVQGESPKTPNDASSYATSLGYCKKDVSTGLRCNDTMVGKIQTDNGLCKLNCNGNTATCS